MAKQFDILRGTAAGATGGLVAAFVMGWFMKGPGNKLEASIDRLAGKPVGPTPHGVNAALKVADAFSLAATGKGLSVKQREKAPNAVHLIFSVVTGGIYGAVAEIEPAVESSAGFGFGSALFVGIGVPALKLGQNNEELKPGELGSSYAAHVVYGVTTEVCRRLLRTRL